MEALRLMAEAPSGSYDEIEKLLSCPICLEVFSKPVVILPCQHNLCQQCAREMFQNSGTSVGSGGRFKCPTCRYDVVLDRKGVFGLQRNLLVENIIDTFLSESTKTSFPKTEQFIACEDHEDEKVNIYCTTCQKPTCSLCKVFGQHQECDVAPMEKIYKEQKKELSDAISILSSGHDRLQGIIAQTEEVGRKMETYAKKVESELNKAFDNLYEALDKRKEEMMSKLAADLQERRQVLEAILKNHKLQLEAGNKLMTSSLSLIDEQNIPQFLKFSRETIEKLVQTASLSENREPPFQIQNMSEFHVNFHFQNEILNKLDFTSLTEEENSFHPTNDAMLEMPQKFFRPINQSFDVIAEEKSDDDVELSADDEVRRSLPIAGSDSESMTSLENDFVTTHTEKSLRGNSNENLKIAKEAKKGRWFDMYVRQLPSPVSMSGFSAPMESKIHMKVVIPSSAISPEEEDLKKENPTASEMIVPEEIDDLDFEIERLLNPRRKRWNSRFIFHSPPELSPKSSPNHFESKLPQDPNLSPYFHRRQRRFQNISPSSNMTSQASSIKLKSNQIGTSCSSNNNLPDSSTSTVTLQPVSSRRQKQRCKSPKPQVGRRTPPPISLLDQDKNQDRRSESPSGNQISRRPRLYCTHKRRTWSHLLGKK